MKFTLSFIAVFVLAGFLTGCNSENPVDLQNVTARIPDGHLESGMSDDLAVLGLNDDSTDNPNFGAVLKGRSEVPPRETRAQGVARFQFNSTGDSIRYKLIVANISNVAAAHVHVGGVGVNGPIVLSLYSAPPGGGRIQGPIAEGTVTAADLEGPFASSANFDLFVHHLHADSLYVNVHTDDGVGAIDTGPGDFANGEIRGQLRRPPVTVGIGAKAPPSN